ncbi:nucleotidyltransferase domain-containing protein, partial [Bacillus sp. B-TM1]
MENVVKHALPKEVEQLMEQYIVGLKEIFLDEKIVGVYIYGSIALGAFHAETSDVDFVTVISDPVNEAEKQQLVELHKKLSGSTLGKRMDGMYIPLADLGKYNDEMNEYVYCADGKANIGHWDINAVTWWTLKNQGITVIGKAKEDLSFQIRWDDVVNTMKYNV